MKFHLDEYNQTKKKKMKKLMMMVLLSARI